MPKISELTELTTGVADTDYTVIVEDDTSDVTKKVTAAEIKKYVSTRTEAVAIAAGSMLPRSTNGCAALAKTAAGSGQPDMATLDFDASAVEYAQFSIAMPSNWDESTITAKFYWSHPSTTTNFTAIWGLQAVAVGDDDAQGTSFGTAQTVSDAGGTTNDLYITAATAAITVAGTPQPGDLVYFQVFRDATAGGDNLAVDARLHAVVLFIGINAASSS